MKDRIVGRKTEKKILQQMAESQEPELLALYGRRRVGKTHLIREFFQDEEVYFELVGQHSATLEEQLHGFAVAFSETFRLRNRLATPAGWREAFGVLARELDHRAPRGKTVIFLDELPWLSSRRSGFLQALDHFWNAWASRRRNILVVVCGSAASWMIRNLIHHKGGLHNRVTCRIRLLPFTLAEAEAYLENRNIHLDRRQILELYMAMGGIPHYLGQVQRGLSAAQNIDRICFSKDGFLIDEYDRLYLSLFDNADQYMSVIQVLARRRSGVTRDELLQSAKIKSGGTATKILKSLEESGFIASQAPYGKKSRDSLYRLVDEYSLFYLTWIRKAPQTALGSESGGHWLQQCVQPAWRAWAGFAFEAICLKHLRQIKMGLGIGGISATGSGWHARAESPEEKGAQIDLLIDRADNCISLCEMKFSDTEFVISKAYADTLRNKREVFRNRTLTRKNLFITMITTHGVRENRYFTELIDAQLTMDVLFAP